MGRIKERNGIRAVILGAALLGCWVVSPVAHSAADVRVNQDVGTSQQQEVDIAVDPGNSNNLASVYIDIPGLSTGVSVSNDGGVTWTDAQLSFDCDSVDNDSDGLTDEELCDGLDNDLDARFDEDLCCVVLGTCDGVDNDGDLRIDEELLDGVDNDGDGFTDEDLCDGLRHIDPAVTIDSAGNIYTIAIAYENAATGFMGSSYVSVHMSSNGGLTWTRLPPPGASVYTPPGPNVDFLDKCWIVADNSPGSPYTGHVYAVWQRDSSVTVNDTHVWISRWDPILGVWNGPNRIDDPPNNCAESPTPVIDAAGWVWVVWRQNPKFCGGLARFWVDFSMDGGATWQPDLPGLQYTQIAESLTVPFRNFRTSDFPVIEVHPLNPAVLFAVYAEDPAGADQADIMFTWSPNAGASWLPAMRVNDDATTHPQYWPAITVQPGNFGNALVDVSWHDERNTVGCDGVDDDSDGSVDEERLNGLDEDSDGLFDEDLCETQVDVFWARNVTEGGWTTFTPNRLVSDVSSSLPLPSPILSPPFGFLGDYMGLASVQGTDFLVWGDTRNGDNDIYFDTMPDIDADGDGALDLADCEPWDAQYRSQPVVVQNLTVTTVSASTNVVVSWTSQDPTAGPGTGYDIVTGLLSELRADTDFSRATCLQNQWANTPYTDTRGNAPVGDAHYFLLRATNPCGSGGYGHKNTSDPRYALDGNAPCPLL